MCCALCAVRSDALGLSALTLTLTPHPIPHPSPLTPHQLDEFSRKGIHSNVTMDQIIQKATDNGNNNNKQPQSQSQLTVSRGLHWKDKLWLEADGSHTWAGPVRWFQGSLQIVHASPEFPAGRELLIFHRLVVSC